MSYINLTEEGKEKLSKLPYILKYMANYLIESINILINGDCDEETLTSTIGSLKQNAQGRISDIDTVNYDEAGKILGFGTTNRSGLKKLLDKNGIKQVVINNQKCGFLLSQIKALKDKLDKDIRKEKKRL